MEEKHRSDNSFLTGLVLGGVIGAGLAFIFGKEEGEEVRKTLAKKGKLLLKNLGEILEEESLKEHWGEEEKERQREKDQGSAVQKMTRRFFHRRGKKLA